MAHCLKIRCYQKVVIYEICFLNLVFKIKNNFLINKTDLVFIKVNDSQVQKVYSFGEHLHSIGWISLCSTSLDILTFLYDVYFAVEECLRLCSPHRLV